MLLFILSLGARSSRSSRQYGHKLSTVEAAFKPLSITAWLIGQNHNRSSALPPTGTSLVGISIRRVSSGSSTSPTSGVPESPWFVCSFHLVLPSLPMAQWRPAPNALDFPLMGLLRLGTQFIMQDALCIVQYFRRLFTSLRDERRTRDSGLRNRFESFAHYTGDCGSQ
jgi:hypothetical protein